MLRSLLVLIFLLLQAPTFAAQDFAATREELALMPPYCTAYYGANVGLPTFNNSPLRNTIPQGCPSIHHYCDGLKSMIRVKKNNKESGYWLTQGIQSFQSVVQGGFWKNCPLQAEAYVNLGQALLLRSAQPTAPSPQAAENYMKALEVQPSYLPAYAALSSYYVRLGDKKKALSTIEEGLRHAPDSKALLRRFKELGGTTLPTPYDIAEKPAAAETTEGVPAQQQPSSTREQGSPAVRPAPASEDAQPAQSSTPKIGTPSNPWCRFCPPE